MNIIAAAATDDGVNTIDRHFGDALQYSIYKITSQDICLMKTIKNDSGVEEEVHADPRKASGVAGLLQNENVNTVVSRAFGPNIKRIKKKFVCVIVNEEKIDTAIDRVQKEIRKIEDEWEKGSERNYLRIK